MRKKTGLGKKRDLDVQLNLTPFIDLLSTCVCFLLVTAVWIEIGSLEVKQSYGTDTSDVKSDAFELDLILRGTANSPRARLNLKKNGRRIRSVRVKGESFEAMLAELDGALKEKILRRRGRPVEIASATVTPHRSVDYGNLVAALDALRKNQIVNVGVLTEGGN